MRTLTLIPATVALCLASQAVATVTAYIIHRAPVSPTMDGEVIGDPAWQAIPEATGFHVLGGGYTVAKQTGVRLCWDAQALYVGFVAEEPDAALIKPQVVDGGQTWLEDSMEVFLQPRPPSGQVFQFGITAGAAKIGWEGFPDLTRFQAAARLGQDTYTIELRVPWGVLGFQARDDQTWRGTVCRNIWTTRSGGDKFTALSPLKAQFSEPANFATLTFSDQVLDPARAAGVSEALNRDYRRELEADLGKLAVLARDYEGTLTSALADPAYGPPARELLDGWQRVQALAGRVAQAPLAELRQVLAGGRTLPQRSHDIKYRILLSQLPLD